MIFRSLHLTGFGVFAEESLDDLSPGLNVLEGPNEAGKSTTVEFIRSLLFGFQTGHGARKFRPLRGGADGGSALIQDRRGRELRWELTAAGGAGGRITIREIGGGEVDRSALLTGADRALFTNIFAFSLDEMVGFKELQAGDVEAKIYGAASGTGGSSLLSAARSVGSQLEGLYKYNGSNPVINTLLRERGELNDRLKLQRAGLDRFNEAKTRFDEAEASLAAVREEERRARQAASRAAALHLAWDSWLDLVDLRERRAALPDHSAVPADAEPRLDACLNRLNLRRDALQKLRQARGDLESALQEITIDEALLSQRAALRDLAEQRTEYVNALADLPNVEGLSRNAAAKAAGALGQLGPDWTEERLTVLDRSIGPRGEIDRFQKSLSQSHAAVQAEAERAQTASLALAQRRKLLAASEAQLAVQFPVEPPVIPDHAARRAALEAAEEALRQSETAQIERRHQVERQEELRRHQEQRAADLRRQEEAARSEAASVGGAPPAWIGFVAIAVGIVLGVMARENLTVAIVVAMAGVALGVVWISFASGEMRRREKTRARLEEQAKALKQQLDALAPTASSTQEIISSGVPPALVALGTFGLRCGSVPEIREELRRLEAAVTLRKEYEIAARETGAHRREVEMAVIDHEAAKQRLKTRQEELAALERRWKSWLVVRGLSAQSEPETAQRLFAEAEKAAGFFHERDAADLRIANIRASIEKFETALLATHERLGLPAPRPEEGVAAHRRLHEGADQQWERARAREEKQAQLTIAFEAEKRAEQELKSEETVLAGLLKSLDATDPEEYRRIAREASVARELEAESRERERRLESLSGPGEVRIALESELASLDQQGVLQRREETARTLEEVEVRRDALQAEIGGLKTLLGQLESADELTSVGRELAAKDAELAEASEQWAALRVTQWLLDQTRKKFETERQPAVVRSAGRLMARFTDNRYANIVAPEGLTDIALETPQGERKKLEAWSRGTREQLYLALRFAFVQDYSSHSEPLPIIMDDVLVHADGYQRRRLAAETIAEVAQGCQVLYFTCHPDHAELLASACPGTHRYKVENAQYSRIA